MNNNELAEALVGIAEQLTTEPKTAAMSGEKALQVVAASVADMALIALEEEMQDIDFQPVTAPDKKVAQELSQGIARLTRKLLKPYFIQAPNVD